MELSGKVGIVTGASAGIGAVLARALSEQGVRVALAARRREKLEEIAKECPNETLPVRCDVTQDKDRKALVEETLRRWGRIDILVNNAGIGMYGPIEHASEADIRRLFEVNVFAVFFLTQLVIPIMKRQGSGMILNIGSIGGVVAHSANVTPYVAAKHAVVGFTRGLRRDLEGTGIAVKVVCPQLVYTDFYRKSIGAERMAGMVERLKDRMDTPEEVVQGIFAQLSSDEVVIFPTGKSRKAYELFRDL